MDPGLRRGDVILPPEVARPLDCSWTEEESITYCARLTKGHYENFPVGSALIPRTLQPAVHSLYAFMRTADDFSDEGRHPGDEEERLAYIKTWDAMLSDCENGKAKHPIFIALRATLAKHPLPAPWLHDLLRAFAMDCTVRRYATFNDLLGYCRLSANPVGRLLLTLFGYRDEALYRLSDAVCTALQLANHWQDVAVDLEKDRIYLPQEHMQKFGVDLSSPPVVGGGSMDPRPKTAGDDAFRRLMAYEVTRTREFFEIGRPLPQRVQGRLRWELRFTWQGGMRILDKIEKVDYDVFTHRPVVTKADWMKIAIRTLF